MKPLKWKSQLHWKRIHIDYAGLFELIIVDSYTKCLEVEVVPSTDSKNISQY